MQDAPLALVRTDDLDAAVDLANAFAPEHLELACADAEPLAERVRASGCVFIGGAGGAAFGDYAAGSNHVLPTGGAARFSGPLGAGDISAQAGAGNVARGGGASARALRCSVARAEGFPVHAESAEARADAPLRPLPASAIRDGDHHTTTRRRDRALHRARPASACGSRWTARASAPPRRASGFLDHMLDLLARHARLDLDVEATGDLETGSHHTTEDIGIVLGQALDQALGDRSGIARYGDATVPMDEALATCAIDISGRPYCVFEGTIPAATIGGWETELTEEFFRAVANNARLTVHVRLLAGTNAHHMVEASFKSFARALRAAVVAGRLARPASRRRRGCCEPAGPRIAILDYGMGNLRSAEKALERTGARPVHHARPRRDPRLRRRGAARRRARSRRRCATSASCELDGLIGELLAGGMPMLGICLGMQLLFETSSENEGGWGLGLLGGRVERLPAPGLKVPHIGWNVVKWERRTALVEEPARRVPVLLRALVRAGGRLRATTCSARPATASRSCARSSASRSTACSSTPRSRASTACSCCATSRRSALRSAPLPSGPAVPALYPAIDILGGKAVRLEQGDFDRRKVYDSDPLDAARRWVAEGATWLHVVDLDGARDGRPVNLEHLERIAATRGRAGPVRRRAADRRGRRSMRVAAGADRVVIGTVAFTEPDVLDAHDRARRRACADRGGRARRRGRDRRLAGQHAIDGPGGRDARCAAEACGGFVYTSVDRDGTLEGPDCEALARVCEAAAARRR